jgi:4'-phosphopantetheinyl transferase
MRCLASHEFIAAAPPVAFAGDEIQLWLFPPLPRDRMRSSDPRWRPLVAGYVGVDAPGLDVGHGEHGKPFLNRPDAPQFNISHSRGVLLAALSPCQPLGVDVEVVWRVRPVLDLARRFFTAGEADALARLDEAHRQSAFLRLWTCKEAVLKALGAGIGFGLDRLEFTLDEHGIPGRLNVIDATAGAAGEWHIVRLEPAPDCYGALAWRGPPRPLRTFAAAGARGTA